MPASSHSCAQTAYKLLPSWVASVHHCLSFSGFRPQCVTVHLFFYHIPASVLLLLWNSLQISSTSI